MVQVSFWLAILIPLGAATKPGEDPDDCMGVLQLTKTMTGLVQEIPSRVHLEAAEVGEPCALGDKLEVAGTRYCVPKLNLPATIAIRAGKVWEPDTHSEIEKYAKEMSRPGDIVTMGLFFGDFLPHLSRLVGDGQRVWGLEPNPWNFKHARGTVWENSLKNVWIANAGGDETDGFFEMCLEKKGAPCGGQCGAGQTDCTSKATIPTLALDSLIPEDRRVNLIHLDVEGFEEHVLGGAKRLIHQWKPLVILENGDREPLKNFMTEMGYKMVKQVESNSFWLAS